MQELKANTSVDVRIGPFVDVGDGFTPEIAIGNTPTNLTGVDEAELLKHNGAATVDITTNTWAAVSGCDGWYDLTLTAGNLDTEGQLTVVIQDDSVCLPVFAHFMVLSQAAWDSKYVAKDTGYMDVNVKAISEDETAANNCEAAFDTTGYGFTGCTMPTVTTLTGHTAQSGDGYAIVNHVTYGNAQLVRSTTPANTLDISATGEVSANLTQIDGNATSGNNATLYLKQLDINNSNGSALLLTSTGGNGHGIYSIGDGTGSGIYSVGGATGAGIFGYGGVTSGPGFKAIAQTSGDGFQIEGAGAGDGLYCVSGATGDAGIFAIAHSSSNGSGIRCLGYGTGHGLRLGANNTGDGLNAVGGTTSGDGINITATSGDGISATGGTNGNGMILVGAGAGVDFSGDITGNITGNLSGSVGSLTGHTNQTGDSYVIVNSGTYGNAQLVRATTPANTLDVNATGEAGIDLDNTSGTLAKTTDITGFNDISASDVWNTAMSDLSAMPAATASALDALNIMFMMTRNKRVYDGTNDEIVLYKDDGTTKVCEFQCSDDGTDFTAGEGGTPD